MDPRTFTQAWFRRIWNEGELAAIDELAAPDARFHGLVSASEQTLTGVAGFKAYATLMRQVFPDLRIEILRCICEGELVALHCQASATHSGAGLGPPTGRRVHFDGMAMARIVDGQLQEAWNCFDSKTMYQQLGFLPPDPH